MTDEDKKENITPVAFAKEFATNSEFIEDFNKFKKEFQNEDNDVLLWLLFTCFSLLRDETGYEYGRDDFHDYDDVGIDTLMQDVQNKIAFLDKDVTHIKRKLKRYFK